MVTGTDADPGSQTIGAAEGIHVGANFDKQHGRTNEVDARQGLQQDQRILFVLKFIQKSGIETGDTCFDLLDVVL